ncbi:MAG: 50S ribosomal protein L19 [Fusobacteria bacterium]|nr:50S ribosomal protein L19 [Fusobacteriota bacterium]
MKNQFIELVERTQMRTDIPEFKAGDTIQVYYKVKEGVKERIQLFQGVCIAFSGQGLTRSFTVRKVSDGIGVERIFPLNSPLIDKLEVKAVGRVRRAKLYYLRGLSGKASRIKEIRR